MRTRWSPVLVSLSYLLTGYSGIHAQPTTPASAVLREPQWTITEKGDFASVENSILHLRFAYVPQGQQGAEGWFKGGGGQDGAIVELYFKPTSATRNLVPRNGTWGGKKDALDLWEAEPAAKNGADHNAPNFTSATDGVITRHTFRQSAGRLIAETEFQLKTWKIQRTYIIYPWGDITTHARLTQTEAGRWNYLGRRFEFAVKPYRVENGKTSYDWGGLYQDDGEFFYAWSDLYGPDGKHQKDEPFVYKEAIAENLNRNTAISMYKRLDPYSGFMIDDMNGNDPDIIVMNGDKATWLSPIDIISRKVGGRSYVETGIYTPFHGRTKGTYATTCWFYATIPCCPPIYNEPMLWPETLGTWDESFHILLRRDLSADDYLPLWRAWSRDVEKQAPFDVTGATVELDEVDRLYHLVAAPGAKAVKFRWKRGSDAPRAIDYRTAFVVEKLPGVASVKIEGKSAPGVQAYPDPEDGSTLLVLAGPQPATSEALLITVEAKNGLG
ncbi:MAG TPA: hypothetical protein VNA16_00720 [Abditibacteriaceae bacterium]|nr:hypothetical protein [Abditibacteriaceae bacterium]